MHCWEERLAEELCKLRQKEVYHKGRTAQIKGINTALQFALTPLMTIVTFAAISATGDGQLDISAVFYAITLLALPKVMSRLPLPLLPPASPLLSLLL